MPEQNQERTTARPPAQPYEEKGYRPMVQVARPIKPPATPSARPIPPAPAKPADRSGS
jgi:hypothetical protein